MRAEGDALSWLTRMHVATQTLSYTGTFVYRSGDQSETSRIVHADFTNSLSIAINSMFAFKPSVQLVWRNDPALTQIDLFAANGTPTGEKVLVPLQKLDSFINLALVVTLK